VHEALVNIKVCQVDYQRNAESVENRHSKQSKYATFL